MVMCSLIKTLHCISWQRNRCYSVRSQGSGITFLPRQGLEKPFDTCEVNLNVGPWSFRTDEFVLRCEIRCVPQLITTA